MKTDVAGSLRQWRTKRGLTQKQLGEKAGLSEAEVAHIESGRRCGRLETLSALAKALKISTGELVDGCAS